jgi:protein-S-isoprenylcysteine O-methyltransferase Ste14
MTMTTDDKRIEKWLVLQIVFYLLIFVVSPFTSLHFPTAIKLLGAILIISGLVLGFMAYYELGASFTPYIKPNEKGYLVTTGVYDVVRHPMYSGSILLAFGWALVWSSIIGIILSIIFAFILDRKANAEETLLSQIYPVYADYKKHVKKFFPLIY